MTGPTLPDDYADDPDWDYGFRLDGAPLVFDRVFGLTIQSRAMAEHAARKSAWESFDIVRHPKGSRRDDDWDPAPTTAQEGAE